VCAPDALETAARTTAEAIAANAPQAVRAAKRLIDQGVQMPLDVGLAIEQQTLSGLYATRDGAEGIAAFLQKRAAHFTGE
jgi:enoyl-CoA hydratase/carnithine racemase